MDIKIIDKDGFCIGWFKRKKITISGENEGVLSSGLAIKKIKEQWCYLAK